MAEHLDHVHYLNDILCLRIDNLNEVLTGHLLNRLFIPLYIYSLVRSPNVSSNSLEVIIIIFTPATRCLKVKKDQNRPTTVSTNGALDLKNRVILPFRSTISTLRFSWKIKYFVEQNIFYILDILHDFSISNLYN